MLLLYPVSERSIHEGIILLPLHVTIMSVACRQIHHQAVRYKRHVQVGMLAKSPDGMRIALAGRLGMNVVAIITNTDGLDNGGGQIGMHRERIAMIASCD